MSKRAKEYIEENTEYADNLIDLYGWGLFNVVEEYNARHAIELAEEDMIDKAGHILLNIARCMLVMVNALKEEIALPARE